MLCWLALPPVGWSWLAWVAPVPWLWLIREERLPGRRPYHKLWIAGVVYWLLAVHWIRLPHPLNYLAWFSLTAYLGVYLPLGVALARTGVHRLGLPLTVVAPVVWAGLDYVRAHFLSGFLMGSLAHTQYRQPWVIQMADLCGEYGVTFVMVLFAACATELCAALTRPASTFGKPLTLLPPFFAVGLMVVILSYGSLRQLDLTLAEKPAQSQRIALIQGNTLADWKSDPAKQQSIMDEYWQLSLEAIKMSRQRDHREVDLVVWPETAFRQTLWTTAEGYRPPGEIVHESHFTAAQDILAELTQQLECGVLVGIDRVEVSPAAPGEPTEELTYRGFNSSVLTDQAGKILATYDKMHLVPFGEFIPLAEWFPVLYRLTPLSGGAEPGEQATAMHVGDGIYSPNICYETAVPHLIRRQVRQLQQDDGERPAALINLTNDAWFWGSSELDHASGLRGVSRG